MREEVFVGRRLEKEDIAVWQQAASERGTRRSLDAQAQIADGDFAVIADADL